MIKQIITFLQEPYPQSDDNQEIVRNGLVTGVIVAFILGVFKPFGFSETSEWIALQFALIFGLITFVVVIGWFFFQKYVLKIPTNHPNWTFGKWIISNLMALVCITITNYFFTVYTYHLPHSFSHLVGIFWSALTIGIFPVTLFGMMVIIRNAAKNEKIASTIHISHKIERPNKAIKSIHLPIQQSDKYFEIDPEKIVCIEAMQNYVQIYYKDGESISKEIIRNTISNIEEALSNTDIQRSHRSFLVNTSKITNIAGNAQGLKLETQPSPGFWVPVSRKYIPAFKNIA